jgi:hypothetical protein
MWGSGWKCGQTVHAHTQRILERESREHGVVVFSTEIVVIDRSTKKKMGRLFFTADYSFFGELETEWRI